MSAINPTPSAEPIVEEANLFIDASHKAHAKWQASLTPAIAVK